MYGVADAFVEEFRKVDLLHIIESVELSDIRTNKLIDDLYEKDELQGKINRYLRT
jgi:hypothetical protein